MAKYNLYNKIIKPAVGLTAAVLGAGIILSATSCTYCPRRYYLPERDASIETILYRKGGEGNGGNGNGNNGGHDNGSSEGVGGSTESSVGGGPK